MIRLNMWFVILWVAVRNGSDPKRQPLWVLDVRSHDWDYTSKTQDECLNITLSKNIKTAKDIAGLWVISNTIKIWEYSIHRLYFFRIIDMQWYSMIRCGQHSYFQNSIPYISSIMSNSSSSNSSSNSSSTTRHCIVCGHCKHHILRIYPQPGGLIVMMTMLPLCIIDIPLNQKEVQLCLMASNKKSLHFIEIQRRYADCVEYWKSY